MSISRAAAAGALVALLLGAYANHFGNGFHFDDDHAITGNPYVRSLRFIPRYFVDAATFSVLPQNQNYRPVAQTTFAIDYGIGGYDARVFQVDTFIWFVLLLASMFALARAVTGSEWQALVATAVFGLHPAIADTVNYIVQRAEILAALGVVLALAVFIRSPSARRSGLYLVPAVAGLLAKATAAAFPLLLIAYLWIYERRIITRDTVVSVVVIGAASIWITVRTPAAATFVSASPALYRLTQPFVALREFGAFFAPIGLSVDYDWMPVRGVADPAFITGAAFVTTLVAIVWGLRRSPSSRAIAFGLAWFLIAQLPTAVVPLSEVGNDWRMLLPFVGLAIALVAAVASVAQPVRGASSAAALTGCAAGAVVILLAEAAGVHARNEVWRTDESLWRDATEKSPENARAWMNLGVALMARSDYVDAAAACERALVLAPDYTLVHINLGVAYGEIGRPGDAEKEFLAAQRLAPSDWRTHLYYAWWLERMRRLDDARREMDRARALNPAATSTELASGNQ